MRRLIAVGPLALLFVLVVFWNRTRAVGPPGVPPQQLSGYPSELQPGDSVNFCLAGGHGGDQAWLEGTCVSCDPVEFCIRRKIHDTSPEKSGDVDVLDFVPRTSVIFFEKMNADRPAPATQP